MLTINLKSRFRNKTFWVSVIGALVLLSQQLGLDISKFIPSNYVDIINTIFVILTLIGITVDTSTPGISDQVVTTTMETTVQAEEVPQDTSPETIDTDATVTIDAAAIQAENADLKAKLDTITATLNPAATV